MFVLNVLTLYFMLLLLSLMYLFKKINVVIYFRTRRLYISHYLCLCFCPIFVLNVLTVQAEEGFNKENKVRWEKLL